MSAMPRPQLAPTAVTPRSASVVDRLRGGDAHHRVPVGVEAERDRHLEIGGGLVGRADDRLGLGQVAHRLGQDQVGAGRGERLDLLLERRLGVVRRQRPERLDQLAGGADVAGDERAELVGDGARDAHGGGVHLGDAIRQAGRPRAAAPTRRTCLS